MSKNKEPQVKGASSKKQRSYWQQQELRQRIIGFIGVAVVAVVVIILASGWFVGRYLPIDRNMRTTVMEVSGQKYNMAYFVNALTYATDDQYLQYGYAEYFIDDTAQLIEKAAIINTASAKLGISVTDDDVNQYLKEMNDYVKWLIELGYDYFRPIQNNAAVRDILRSELLEQRLKDDYFGTNIPTTAEYRDVVAMFLESQSQLDEVRARLAMGEDFDDLAKEYSLDSITKDDSGVLGSHPMGVFDYKLKTSGMDDAIFRQSVNSLGVYYDKDFSKKIGYWLVKITERDEDNDKVRVSGMLLSNEDDAKEIKARLDRGEDFTALAEQYSQCWSDEDKDDFGWLKLSSINAAYSSYVSDEDIAIGKVSDPIKDTAQSTDGGYWLFKVVASTPGEDVTVEDRTTLISKAFDEWLDEQKADTQAYPVINYLDDEMRKFAASRAGK